ncbi:Derlin-3 [Seminavis robusta]|uniref:Derlin n=1 Tax=Seminavis robusta TaxID=568900 RepID=A0A9N8H4Q0_9STRA|nr:Derlin-3 [Seminavis robusta]|eukprot:Sro68_g038300.1 Derlin-3 (356) ;mRNA; r:113133-114380
MASSQRQPRIQFAWRSILLLAAVSLLVDGVTSRSTFSPLAPFTRSLRQQQQQQQQSACPQYTSTLLQSDRFRGGALDDDDEYDEESEDESEFDEDEEDDEDLFDLDEGDFEDAEDEFAEAGYVERALESWSKTPPLTKGYLSASMAATVFGFVFHKNEFPPWLLLEWKPFYSKLQLWRPFTTFLNFGPLGLGYILTFQFVWQYMSTLERLHHSTPYDFWIMILFGQLSMVIGYPILKLSPRFLGHNLSTFLVYIWSRFHEGLDCNLFELFNAKAELLPWFFLAQTFLLEGEPPILDFLGIVFGHVYYHLNSVGTLKAPPALLAWYKGDSGFAKDLRSKYAAIGQDFELVADDADA